LSCRLGPLPCWPTGSSGADRSRVRFSSRRDVSRSARLRARLARGFPGRRIGAGVERGKHAHRIRHEAITDGAEKGVGLRDLQLFARHADQRTTERYIDSVKNVEARVARLVSEDKPRRATAH
jgi:integrase